MNELTKPIHDCGDTVPLQTTFVNAETGEPTNPTTATLLLMKDGIELLRVVSPDAQLLMPGSGVARLNYRIIVEPAPGLVYYGRYSFRFFGTGAVSSAEEDWFYVRKSAFTNPIES